MTVEYRKATDTWRAMDGDRAYEATSRFVEMAYSDYLRRLSELRQRRGFVASDEVPTTTTKLPTLPDFVELLAKDEWERNGR